MCSNLESMTSLMWYPIVQTQAIAALHHFKESLSIKYLKNFHKNVDLEVKQIEAAKRKGK